jgi:hypothetical protein
MTKKHQKPQKQNSPLQAARKKIIIQAVIAIQTIVITLALVFGMSAAWYTNVLQTSGLQFQAAAWGFTGEVLVDEKPVEASPGDTGIVGLAVTNTSDDIVEVAVRVSKEQMEVPMRQRFFFYVETSEVRNAEVLDRVYINSKDSYTYSILSQSELVLTQERANDVQLKWQWVYDMLGYYFVGTVSSTAANNEMIVSAQIEDYLRPVEYDLDKATFADGMLATVDGENLDAFLNKLSKKDGYLNNLEKSDIPGYYEVDVDENGYGIWVYLCNWAEIQQATTYDSQLGKEAADALLGENVMPKQFTARLSVVGQETRQEYAEATTAPQLAELLNRGELVKLEQDLVLTEPLVVNKGIKTVLDLNGHSITGAAGAPLLQLSESAYLTLMNGQIVANDSSKDVISVSNSSLTLSKVEVTGNGDDAIDISDQNGSADSCIRVFDSKIDMAGCAVFIRGNGEVSEAKTQIIIEDSELNSGYVAIMGNGNNPCWGTDVQIYHSVVTGKYAAVYQPQIKSLTRVTNGSTLTGNTAIVMKGGDLEIIDSTVHSIGEAKEPAYSQSGFEETGDAILIDCSYNVKINVSISGKSVISSDKNKAVRVFVPAGYENHATVILTGGTYSSDVSEFVAEGYIYDPVSKKVVFNDTPEETVSEPTETTTDAVGGGSGDAE